MAEEFDSDENMETDDSDTDSEETESDDEPVNEKITLKARKDRRSSGKWKLLNDKKMFKNEWLDIYPWVGEDPRDAKLAFCKVCNTSIKAMRGILESHQKSKRHLKNSGCPDYAEEPKKEERSEPKAAPGIDQITEEQISFFAESQADAAHQAVTTIIDKLVEKYHESRLQNLKVQNEAVFQLNVEKAKLIRSENQRKLERRLQQEAYMREAEETRLKFLQIQHDTKINAIEDEKVAKLRAMEQGLVYAKQEYEKKMKFLDSQISSMK